MLCDFCALTSLQRWSSDFCKRFHPKVQLVERNHLLAVWGFDPKLHRCWLVRDQAGSRQRSGILFHEVFECIKTESAQILKESQTEISLYKGRLFYSHCWPLTNFRTHKLNPKRSFPLHVLKDLEIWCCFYLEWLKKVSANAGEAVRHQLSRLTFLFQGR